MFIKNEGRFGGNIFAHDYFQVVFPIIPQVCDIERMKQGGEHWQWSPETPFYIGVLPRKGGKGTDVKVNRSSTIFSSLLTCADA